MAHVMRASTPFHSAFALAAGLCVLTPRPAPAAPSTRSGAVDVRIVTDEADAALAILDRLRDGKPVRGADWQQLHASDGYQRLKRRETTMGRAFEDSTFAAFVSADSTRSRADALGRTVTEWKRSDLAGAGRRALDYLPAGARIRAKVYLTIKPRANSFVFEAQSDPAIILYVDPNVTRAQFENTVAHELHHIGFASACAGDEDSTRSAAVSTCRTWLSAFGEGLAMLAAAGGPGIHPHAESGPDDRARWDRDMERFDDDVRSVRNFLEEIMNGRLSDPDSVRARGMEFFGVQGPWYTVGYRMAVTIERMEGRAALIAVICDPVELLRAYNRAARNSGSPGAPALPLRPVDLLNRLESE